MNKIICFKNNFKKYIITLFKIIQQFKSKIENDVYDGFCYVKILYEKTKLFKIKTISIKVLIMMFQ